jgi:hypothetical protein
MFQCRHAQTSGEKGVDNAAKREMSINAGRREKGEKKNQTRSTACIPTTPEQKQITS